MRSINTPKKQPELTGKVLIIMYDTTVDFIALELGSVYYKWSTLID